MNNVYLRIELYRADHRLAWGDLFCTEEESCATFDVAVRVRRVERGVQYFSGLLIKSHTDDEGLQLHLELYDLIDKEIAGYSNVSQELVFHSTIGIPEGFSTDDFPDSAMQLTEVYSLRFLEIVWLREGQ